MHVAVLVGTRPEVIKMAPVIYALKARGVTVSVCSTGQHKEMLERSLEDFGLTVDYGLNIMRPNQSLGALTAGLVREVDPLLEALDPEWLLVQGDTTSVFVGALCAFYHKIKIGHIEAGLRTFDKFSPFPEEVNRRLTGNLADYHFAPTEQAKQNLLAENIAEDRIFVVGNTVVDAVQHISSTVGVADLPEQIQRFVENNEQIMLVTCHRRENQGKPLENICSAIKQLANQYGCKVVFPVHLNPRVQSVVTSLLEGEKNILLLPPLSYRELVAVMKVSFCILSDSGGIQEEAPSLGVPVLVLRESTERPEGVIAGTSILVGTDIRRIVDNVTNLLTRKDTFRLGMSHSVNPYGDGLAAHRIVKVLLHGE